MLSKDCRDEQDSFQLSILDRSCQFADSKTVYRPWSGTWQERTTTLAMQCRKQ
jgi:hypothetical protein